MAGQLVVSSLDIKREFDIPVTEVDIMEEDEDFVWKGQGGLGVRSEYNHFVFDITLDELSTEQTKIDIFLLQRSQKV